jgi:hypothetical protein
MATATDRGRRGRGRVEGADVAASPVRDQELRFAYKGVDASGLEREAVGVASAGNLKFTGLAQNSQVGPAFWTRNPYESLKVGPKSGPTL